MELEDFKNKLISAYERWIIMTSIDINSPTFPNQLNELGNAYLEYEKLSRQSPIMAQHLIEEHLKEK